MKTIKVENYFGDVATAKIIAVKDGVPLVVINKMPPAKCGQAAEIFKSLEIGTYSTPHDGVRSNRLHQHLVQPKFEAAGLKVEIQHKSPGGFHSTTGPAWKQVLVLQ